MPTPTTGIAPAVKQECVTGPYTPPTIGAVVNKFAEFGDEANCEVDDVKDEIFDMVKPRDPMLITLNDLIACKVGDTVVGMLTDMTAFAAYDRREQNLDHSGEES